MTQTAVADGLGAGHGRAGRRRQRIPWVQLVPFALVLGIFYFIILLPMKRKQKKVQEFLDALKVGDRVVTTSGIYGQITRLGDKSVQLQIADKVRIEVAKAAVGGYQGQEPVAPDAIGPVSNAMDRTCAGRSSTILAVVRRWLHLGASIPPRSEDQARARPQGRRAPRPARADRRRAAARDRDEMERLREALRPSGVSATTFTARRVRRSSGSRACRRTRTRRSARPRTRSQTNFDRESGVERHLHVHDEAEHAQSSCARRPSSRRGRRSSAASTSSASPSRASRSRAPTATRSWCSCPASPTSTARRRSSGRPALLELKIVEDGPGQHARRRCSQTAAASPADMEVVPGASDPAARRPRRARSTTWCARSAAVTGRDLRNARPSLDENNRPAVSFTLNTDGARKFGKVTGENIGRHLAIILDGRVQSAPRIDGAHHRPTAASPAASRSRRSQNLVADPAVGRAAGVADLSRGADDRAEPRRRLDPLRRHRVARRPAARSSSSC